MAKAVAILSLHEDRFLRGLRDDPESTLWSYGFALSPREMQSIREVFGSEQEQGPSDEDILRNIEAGVQLQARRWPW